MHPTKSRLRQLLAAAAVVLGIVSGVLVNLITAHWGWGLAAGLVTVVLSWVAVEWWRAADQSGDAPEIRVEARSGGTIQHSETRVRGGQATTVRRFATRRGRIEGSPVNAESGAEIRQTAGKDSVIADSPIHIE